MSAGYRSITVRTPNLVGDPMWRPTVVLFALLAACQPAPPPATPDSAAANPADTGGTRDSLLLASVKVALPPPGIAVGDLPDPGSPGAVLLATHCAQCHDLPSPAMHSATDWPSVVRRMWLRMDRPPAQYGVAAPDQGGRSTMLTYLTTNALPVSGATLPAGEGREVFAAICSRCHALPDPRVHSPQDWLTVYLRMEQNMERMNVSRASQGETALILGYLQKVSGE